MNSPLEQFSTLPIFSLSIATIDFSFTNSSLYACIIPCILAYFYYHHFISQPTLYSKNIDIFFFEFLVQFVQSLLKEQLPGKNSLSYFPLIFSLFLFLLIANLSGLIPFGFALTAQLVVAFTLSFALFIGVTLIGVFIHGFHFISFFLPSGAPLNLAPLLVIIELISYIFRPISLGVRLFANITAGHSLMNIIASFAWTIAGLPWVAPLAFIPLVVLLAIYGLELAVAFLQAYVFAILLCIYLKDAIELH